MIEPYISQKLTVEDETKLRKVLEYNSWNPRTVSYLKYLKCSVPSSYFNYIFSLSASLQDREISFELVCHYIKYIAENGNCLFCFSFEKNEQTAVLYDDVMRFHSYLCSTILEANDMEQDQRHAENHHTSAGLNFKCG